MGAMMPLVSELAAKIRLDHSGILDSRPISIRRDGRKGDMEEKTIWARKTPVEIRKRFIYIPPGVYYNIPCNTEPLL